MADANDYSAQRIADLEKALAAANKAGAEKQKSLELLTKQIDGFTSKLKDMESTHAKERSNWEASEALMRSGVTDPEMGAFLRFRYDSEKVAEGQERPAFADWIGAYKESNSALFGAPEASGAPSASPAPSAAAAPGKGGQGGMSPAPAARPLPTESGVSTTTAPRGGRFNPREVANMSAEDFKQYRAQIFAQASGRPDSNQT